MTKILYVQIEVAKGESGTGMTNLTRQWFKIGFYSLKAHVTDKVGLYESLRNLLNHFMRYSNNDR